MSTFSKFNFPYKSVVATISAAVIVGFVAFTYRNIELPKHNKKTEELEKKINEGNEIEKEKTLQFEMLKINVNANTIKIDYMVKKIDEMSEDQKELLRWIIRNNRDIKNELSKN